MKKLFKFCNSALNLRFTFLISISVFFNFFSSDSYSQILQLGQSVVTSFEYNNPNYYVVRVIDIRNRPPFITGGTYWNAPPMSASTLWTNQRMGNVYGIALDDENNPNIYISRSTVYCSDPIPQGNDSALIYKIDGDNGLVQNYISPRNIVLTGPPPTGVDWIQNVSSRIGNICYDRFHNQLFVTNHQDGRIYRIKDNVSGTRGIVQSYYPLNVTGVTSGFIPLGKRLWGIGVYGTSLTDVRVYYSKWNSDKSRHGGIYGANEIWSIALNNNGDFISNSERPEVTLPNLGGGLNYSNPVADIEFSFDGAMLSGERTMNGDMGVCGTDIHGNWSHQSRILEYNKDVNGFYSNLKKYLVGNEINRTNSCGGVDFSYGNYDSLSNLNSNCDSVIVGTGDVLMCYNCSLTNYDYVYGVQITKRSHADAINAENYSHYIDINNVLSSTNDKTSPGEVDVYRKDLCSDTNTCMTILSDTTFCDSTGAYIYQFQIRNNSYTKFIEQLEIAVDSPQPPNYVVALPSTINVTPALAPRAASQVYRVKLTGPGAVAYAEVCYTLSAHFVNDDCPWCCFIENCIKLPQCGTCATVLWDSIKCVNGDYFYKFQLKNGTIYDVTKIQLTAPGIASVAFVPQIFHFGSPILPGQNFPILTAQIIGGYVGLNFPIRIKLFSGTFECCYFELSKTLPSCVPLHLNLGAFIQGRYNDSKDLMIGDNIEVELRNNYSPYDLVESASGYLTDSGQCSLDYHYAVNGVNYYIVLKHRNSIETWSMSPGQSFTGDVLNFNFLTSANAYGGNLGLIDSVPLWYGILSGDVNQDGIVDAADLSLIDNDASVALMGNLVTDLNGDLIVDALDLAIVENNTINSISVIRP